MFALPFDGYTNKGTWLITDREPLPSIRGFETLYGLTRKGPARILYGLLTVNSSLQLAFAHISAWLTTSLKSSVIASTNCAVWQYGQEIGAKPFTLSMVSFTPSE